MPVRTHLARSRTYSGRLPLFSLDTVCFDEHLELTEPAIMDNRKILVASTICLSREMAGGSPLTGNLLRGGNEEEEIIDQYK